MPWRSHRIQYGKYYRKSSTVCLEDDRWSSPLIRKRACPQWPEGDLLVHWRFLQSLLAQVLEPYLWYCSRSWLVPSWLHGLPVSIVSDCNSESLWSWREVHQLLGVKLLMLIAFHSQTDSEQMCHNLLPRYCIQWVVHPDQKDWLYQLEFVINNCVCVYRICTFLPQWKANFLHDTRPRKPQCRCPGNCGICKEGTFPLDGCAWYL